MDGFGRIKFERDGRTHSHTESTAKITECHPWTRVSRMIHAVGLGVRRCEDVEGEF